MRALPLVLFAAVAICSPPAAAQRSGDDARPNIVFVFSDDHAPHAIGAYGGRLAALDPTPEIDRLAAEGMRFANCFCTNSICGPSRAVIQTGLHSHRNGFMNNGNRFDADQTTFPKLLRAAGYRTAMFGKWHLKSTPQGFDAWEVLPGQGAYYNPKFLSADGERVIEGHCTDIVTDLAIDWLESQKDGDAPFLLMCQHKAPHRNWMPAPRHLDLYDDVDVPEPDTLFDRWLDNASPARNQEMEIDRHMYLQYDLFVSKSDGLPDEEDGKSQDRSGFRNLQRLTDEQRAAWEAAYGEENADFGRRYRAGDLRGEALVRWKYQRYLKNYLRCVKGVDESLGRIRRWLADNGLADNTIVVYSSDQGFFLGEHGWYDKRWIYDESLAMPFIVSWPGVTQPGSVDEHLVQNLDFAETFLDMAGVAIPETMQGRSLVPLLRGESPSDWRDAIYYHYYEFPSVHQVARHYGVRNDRYKLAHFYLTGEWELYDLVVDPDELTNRYDDPAYRDIVTRMAVRLGQLREQYGDTTGK